ncbi:hypothetical protein E0Z10_g10324 [Xylaria hypoxylon]|uniref:Uncharacterized protein n=1 Tax=Xylaria hypoxylon TaxID=37992 RepID=A0A4Z0Y3V4_9PEZI|nr:hypothetical protein E0Z10_g10324 [Xylaria hypoxylon]
MTSLEVMTSLGQPAWSATDDESLNLILSLLHDDARQITFTSKGKGVEGTCSDADLALQLHTEELDRATTYLSDRRMTRSVQGAVQTDIHALLASELQESVARGDRAIAIAQSAGTPHGQTQTPVNTGPSAAELETWNKLKSTYITGSGKVRGDEVSDDRIETMSTEMDSQPESSSWAASRGAFKSHNRPDTFPKLHG